MKEQIKKLLREGLLGEERYGSANLSNETILVSDRETLTLYNTSFLKSNNPEEGVLGFIAIGNNRGNLYVELSAAKKGFGPFMYELAMQSVYNNPLMPDFEGNSNNKALRMWDYFYKGNNPDVKVVELKEGDEGYRDFIGFNGVDDSVLHLFNSRFYMEPDDLYVLESNSDDFFEENNNYEIAKKITTMGHDYFNHVY